MGINCEYSKMHAASNNHIKNCHLQRIQSVTVNLVVSYCNNATGFVLHNLQSVLSTISTT
jgi:hypothetical protein